MASPIAVRRLRQDYLRVKRDPVPYVDANPLPSNILEWYYVVKGPEDSPYHGGFYLGKLVFPKDYPFKPPRIMMITPNGRFQTNTRLCLSISDFHPDTWNPAWSVATILTGLLSFMLETTSTVGSIQTTVETKKSLAVSSWDYNLKHTLFTQLFPTSCEEIKKAKAEYQANLAHPETVLVPPNHLSSNRHHHGYCTGTASNVLLFVGVILFAGLVNLLLKSVP
ncbi:ubiquitin-conjugating enzyme E2 J2-like [Halichondria panicea]|uniref:ubiquitin-conjugating enzyme E2 J2-like n=1 Tax=Halichondria panicea TaxID=6063 RepID=UPI00312B6831